MGRWRRAPLRAELSGAVAVAGAVVFALLFWKTGQGPYAGGALALAAAGVLLARPIRED